MPSDAELRAHAAQLGVDLAARGARARVATSLLAAREAPATEPEQPEAGEGALLSSTQLTVPGGVLLVEVSFYATSTSPTGSEPATAPDDDRPTDDPAETTRGA